MTSRPAAPLPSSAAGGERLARERAHHRRIAGRAEEVWNWDTPAGRQRADRRATLFVEHGALRRGRSALELGCGTGVFLERVARCGARVRGLDLSPDLLAVARARLHTVDNVQLDCGDAESMPYADASFDTAYGSSVLHHLDVEAALREVLRVLRPAGRAVFAEPNIVNPQVAFMFYCRPLRKYFGVSPDEMAFSRFRAEELVRRAGFDSVSVQPFEFLHPAVPLRLIQRASRFGRRLERIPLVREIAGSLLITARKP